MAGAISIRMCLETIHTLTRMVNEGQASAGDIADLEDEVDLALSWRDNRDEGTPVPPGFDRVITAARKALLGDAA